MHKYLFITYGEKGWRGVQMRAIRIASYLPKKEVLFWECDDPNFIKEYGFDVVKKPARLIAPSQIEFPKGVEVVVFADLPSNQFFNYGVYIAALKQQKKVVICEQLYRKGQMTEGVFKEFALQSDLFLLNGLSAFSSEEKGSVVVVPPQIEMSFSPSVKERIRKKYGIPAKSLILFGAGYNPKVLSKIEAVSRKLSKKGYDFYTIISGSKEQSDILRKGNIIYLPFQSGEEYFKLLYAADIVLVKFGFLQILESLALHKPTIVLGEGGYVLRSPKVLDRRLQNVLHFEPNISKSTLMYFERLLGNAAFRKSIIKRIEKLHDGSLFGAREAAEEIIKLRSKKIKHRQEIKKVAILINDEVMEKQAWLKREERVYPLCFILPVRTQKTDKPRLPKWTGEMPVGRLNPEQKEILPHAFKHVFLFSKRKLDGLIDIMPWYEEWLEQIVHILEAADIIYLTPQGKELFESFLKKKTIAKKVRLI